MHISVMYLSRQPPLYRELLPRFAAATIPWMLFAHLLVACWMFANTESLDSPSDEVTVVPVGQRCTLVFSLGTCARRPSTTTPSTSRLRCRARTCSRCSCLHSYAVVVVFRFRGGAVGTDLCWVCVGQFVGLCIAISILFGDKIFRRGQALTRWCQGRASRRHWPNGQRPGIEDDWEEYRYDPPPFTDGKPARCCCALNDFAAFTRLRAHSIRAGVASVPRLGRRV